MFANPGPVYLISCVYFHWTAGRRVDGIA